MTSVEEFTVYFNAACFHNERFFFHGNKFDLFCCIRLSVFACDV